MQAPSRLKDGRGGRAAEAAADSREQRVSEQACGPSEQGGGKAVRISLNPLKAVGECDGGWGGKVRGRNSWRQSTPPPQGAGR